MRYRRPVVTQDIMVRLWAEYQAYISDCQRVVHLLRTGSEIEHGTMKIDYEAIAKALPAPLVIPQEEDAEHLRAHRTALLGKLLSGADLELLKREGLHRSARRQRRANARLYAEILSSLASDVRRGKEAVKLALRTRDDYSRLEDLVHITVRLHRIFARFRFALLLYRVHLPGAPRIIASTLEMLPSNLLALCRLLKEVWTGRTITEQPGGEPR